MVMLLITGSVNVIVVRSSGGVDGSFDVVDTRGCQNLPCLHRHKFITSGRPWPSYGSHGMAH